MKTNGDGKSTPYLVLIDYGRCVFDKAWVQQQWEKQPLLGLREKLNKISQYPSYSKMIKHIAVQPHPLGYLLDISTITMGLLTKFDTITLPNITMTTTRVRGKVIKIQFVFDNFEFDKGLEKNADTIFKIMQTHMHSTDTRKENIYIPGIYIFVKYLETHLLKSRQKVHIQKTTTSITISFDKVNDYIYTSFQYFYQLNLPEDINTDTFKVLISDYFKNAGEALADVKQPVEQTIKQKQPDRPDEKDFKVFLNYLEKLVKMWMEENNKTAYKNLGTLIFSDYSEFSSIALKCLQLMSYASETHFKELIVLVGDIMNACCKNKDEAAIHAKLDVMREKYNTLKTSIVSEYRQNRGGRKGGRCETKTNKINTKLKGGMPMSTPPDMPMSTSPDIPNMSIKEVTAILDEHYIIGYKTPPMKQLVDFAKQNGYIRPVPKI
jgi:hypothetical protein